MAKKETLDLTLLYYTGNASERPFFARVREHLLSVASDLPLISVTQKPLAFGQNICVGEIGRSHLNIYRQILAGAKAATTRFVALCEDDALYPRERFLEFPQVDDAFIYDMHRWSLYTWTDPAIYSLKNRHTNVSLIAPRQLLIEALEERFAKFPDDSKVPLARWAEPGRYEKLLGVTERKIVEYVASEPTVVFTHEDALGYALQGKRKRLGKIRAWDIPYWGKAQDVLNNYYL